MRERLLGWATQDGDVTKPPRRLSECTTDELSAALGSGTWAPKDSPRDIRSTIDAPDHMLEAIRIELLRREKGW